MSPSRDGAGQAVPAAAGGASLPWLVGDIGGTNARFGWVADTRMGVQHVRTLPVARHAGLAEAVHSYLDGLAAGLGAAPASPRRAALAVATAVAGDSVDLTNSHWQFSRAALQAEFGLDALLVLNDFEALALSLPRLRPEQLRRHDSGSTLPGTMAVIGPGTGLGVAGVTPLARGWLALPSEGGHATLCASDDFESALLQHVRRDYPHVSAERLLSGIGLPVLHQAVAAMMGVAAPALATPELVARGVAGSDALCARALDVFCALLGGFAGNVALTLGARGGVYIGGGIVPRMSERFFASRFRERFEAKGRFQGYLAAIPTALITDTLAALSGAALALEQHSG